MAGASGAESLRERGQVVAHIAEIEQAAVSARLVMRMVMTLVMLVTMMCLPSWCHQDGDEYGDGDDVSDVLACCKRIPGRSPSFPSLITFWSHGNFFPSSLCLSALPSSQGNLLFSPRPFSCLPDPARKLLPTFSGESKRPVFSPFWKLDLPGEISRGPLRSSEEYGCWTGE